MSKQMLKACAPPACKTLDSVRLECCSQYSTLDNLCSFFLSSPQHYPPSSPFSRVILSVPNLSVQLHLQDAVISLAWLDVYCEAEIENGL